MSSNEINENILDSTNYLLDKKIWEQYNMTIIREKVIDCLKAYKEARALSVHAITYMSSKLTSKLDPNKVFSAVRSNVSFANTSNDIIDAEELVRTMTPIINTLKNSFTEEELLFYEYCLATNHSEGDICLKLGVSKTGLAPIKNSCILKFAFAFNLQVRN